MKTTNIMEEENIVIVNKANFPEMSFSKQTFMRFTRNYEPIDIETVRRYGSSDSSLMHSSTDDLSFRSVGQIDDVDGDDGVAASGIGGSAGKDFYLN